ncbi:MAG: hypothetical protein JL50_16565 [Peptococcaceae bacterium BICA1-7]|nr:MAG: hypothetical protein JL50_16565 [Peptococcaceae bacterium BICA1-7]HBV96594.1 flagellar cap protein [Desulfotomaculum sp.]
MSSMRIGGLASGMDIDQLVSDLMKAQRMRSESIKQKYQQLEWQQSDYRTINNSLRSLRDAAFNMRLSGTYQAKKATSSNESVVAASANATAASGTYSVTVHQLAEGVTKGSQVQLADEVNSEGNAIMLKDQFSGLSDTITFTLVGKMESDGITRASKDFTIYTKGTSINALVAEINQYSDDLGIAASYDSANNRFFLSSTGIGHDSGIGVLADSDSLLSSATGNANDSVLKLALQTGAAVTAGKDAIYDFGDAAGMTSSSNTVLVNGITLTLKDGQPADPKTATVTVAHDPDAVYDSIVKFIDQYNTTIDLINGELREVKYKSYLPLTDEQREQLSDEQEKDWDEKAKSGLLKGDTYLSGLMSKVRGAMSSIVSGLSSVVVDGKSVTHNNLSSIGIITTKDYMDGGKLYLKNDGADLKKAIQNDPEGVMKLFNNDSEVSGELGIARRLYNVADAGVDQILEKAGMESSLSEYDDSIMGKKLEDMNEQIERWEDRLAQIEDRYWRQFTAMEKAISQMNSQSSWLAQQFGGQ